MTANPRQVASYMQRSLHVPTNPTKLFENKTSRGVRTSATFGPVLRRLRKPHGSQEAFAHAAQVDRTYMSQMERGIRQPTIAVFMQIAPVLGMSPATFMEMTFAELIRQKFRMTSSNQHDLLRRHDG